ncbi:MAG: ATP-binding protein [Terracidiphilus sp.]|jgi:two-component system, NtrC family, nitrogen regulation sensor histidine kinase NtrY
MNLRQKLLLLFSLTVAAAVAAVAWTVLVRIRLVFEQRDQQETALFVSQFQREFQHRSTEVAAAVDHVAASERVRAMAFELVQSGDASPYLTEAETLAQDAQLDFLEIVGPDGKIVSSAQWPARFGYFEPIAWEDQPAFLKTEDLPDGTSALGLFAIRAVGRSESTAQPVHLIGGKRLDKSFLADLPIAPGMQIALYRDGDQSPSMEQPHLGPDFAVFDPKRLISDSGEVPYAARYEPLIQAAIKSGQQTSSTLYLTDRRENSVNATAIPLKSDKGDVLAVLTVSISRSGMVQAQQHIRAIAYGVAAGGILFAIVCSLWIAAKVSRPIEQLARAAEQVAAGNWETHVPERSRDEVGLLARSFNHMTGQLVSQRDRLVQTERVAAWRELARRLAHELKNPLFPLQLTVENLVRAHELSPAEFDEVFRESTQTLSMEIANLKTIIGRFSDFSKMPKPELERIDASNVIERVRSLYEKAGSGVNGDHANIQFELNLSPEPMPLHVDPELLHRALSNLVLNAMDAMPDGGVVALSAQPKSETVEIRVADTGEGMTPEECERLFTPYYTTKQHGTGLGLAIVQSVIADHAGTIAVESRPGGGATFVITLPKAKS